MEGHGGVGKVGGGRRPSAGGQGWLLAGEASLTDPPTLPQGGATAALVPKALKQTTGIPGVSQ